MTSSRSMSAPSGTPSSLAGAPSPPEPALAGPVATLQETRAALRQLVKRKFGPIPLEPVVELVLRMTEGADWPVRKAAMEAVLRRLAFGKRDGVSVLNAPGRALLGTYRVGRQSENGPKASRAGRGTAQRRVGRVYRTELLSLEPLRMSCECPDFVRSSLGVCKHGLVVLEATYARNKRKKGKGARTAVPKDPARVLKAGSGALERQLRWDPRHPLQGDADRLGRLLLTAKGVPVPGFARGVPSPARLRDPKKRVALVEATQRAVRENKLRAEPAALSVLEEEGRRARERLESQRAAKRSAAWLSSLKRKLYPYQRQGVERFLQTGRLLLADDMGLGKTTQAIAACHVLYGAGLVERGLLIVPASLKSQWQREWEATTDVPLTMVEGTPDGRERLYREVRRGFLLMGYEQLLRDFETVRELPAQMVVLDEAQRIKNWATKTAAFVKALSPRYRLVLTGTPMENRFEELASLMDFVDDTALEPKWRLLPWHSFSKGDGERGRGGARNLTTLRERLAPAFLRRVRSEVLSQLPTRTDTRVPVTMTEAQLAEHDSLSQPIAVLVHTAARRPLTQAEFLRLMSFLTTQRMLCNGIAQVNFKLDWARCQQTERPSEAFMRSLFAPKLSVFQDLIEQLVIGQGRKTVVFSQWRRMLHLAEWSMRSRLQDAGQRAAFFTGAESRKQRERALIDFHDDPEVSVLFLSDAGGVGLNLQRAASCCINLELPWNPAVLEQRIGRIYRLGQNRAIDVFNLVSEQGIEERIARLVSNKKAVFDALFDGTSDEVRFDDKASFLDGVKKLVDTVDLPPPRSEAEQGAETDELDELGGGGDLDDAAVDDLGEIRGGAEDSLGERNDSVETEVDRAARRAPEGKSPAPPSGLSVTRLADGGLRIDAPPALATPLAELLETLAKGLRSGGS